jgi:hypothetical protein
MECQVHHQVLGRRTGEWLGGPAKLDRAQHGNFELRMATGGLKASGHRELRAIHDRERSDLRSRVCVRGD